MALTVDHLHDGRSAVLRLTGELDALGVNRLRQAAVIDQQGLHLLVDLLGVHFVDAAGIGAIIGIIRRNRERGGRTALVARGSVLAALRETGMQQIVMLAEQTEAALAALLALTPSLDD